jgi:hypothetical protein
MTRIYILDEIEPKPGGVEAYRSAYLADYAPGARARGMALEAVRLSPPVELPAGGNTLSFLWSVPDVAAWWAMRLAGEAEKAAWWARSAELAISRSRRYLTDLAGVG